MRFDIGGKGINVARVLKELSYEALAVGFAPGDLGRVIEDQLLDSGIGCDFLHVPGETRTNISVLDRETHRHTLLAAPGPTIEAHAFGLLQQRLRRRIRPGMWVVLAGSIPPPGAVAPYVDLIWMVQEQRGYVALDADGPVVADILAAGAFPTLLKLNQREIGRLVDVPVDGARAALAAARRVQARGVPNVIVTLGAAGAVACTEAGDFRVHAPAVQVDSTIGAGDGFLGGLLLGLARGDGWEAALPLASAVGSACCVSPGTLLCRGADVPSLMEQTRVEALDTAPALA